MEKCQKGLFACCFPIGAFMSRDRLWVVACNWKWDREEWGVGICVYIHFLVAIVSTPSMVYTFTEAATTEAQHREGRKRVVKYIHDYGNMLRNE